MRHDSLFSVKHHTFVFNNFRKMARKPNDLDKAIEEKSDEFVKEDSTQS